MISGEATVVTMDIPPNMMSMIAFPLIGITLARGSAINRGVTAMLPTSAVRTFVIFIILPP